MSRSIAETMADMPLIAVLRGISPEEAAPIADALVGAGIRILEVTLDSPEPFKSLETLAARCGGDAIVGAGTVLRADDVSRVKDAGGTLIVAPNFSSAVVAETKAQGLTSAPGVMTPTEAFAALEAGADLLKLFPGDAVTPKVVKGLRAVLPDGVILAVTGGVTAQTIPDFLQAGATGVGLGSALFMPGKSAAAVAKDARLFVAAARPDRAEMRA